MTTYTKGDLHFHSLKTPALTKCVGMLNYIPQSFADVV